MNNLGYCCINLSLEKDEIRTNRGMNKKTFNRLGPNHAADLAKDNLTDLIKVLHWNAANNIKLYRMSSDIFPWMSEYRIEDLPGFGDELLPLLLEAGKVAMETGQRLTFHPGPFNVLCSPEASVVEKTINELDRHALIMSMMNLESSHTYPINIHVGGSYGDKPTALNNFCNNFKRLSDNTQNRLVVENDDKVSQYSVLDLYQYVYSRIGIPVTFDYMHHAIHPDGLTEHAALRICKPTWKDCRQLTHYSSSRQKYEDETSIERAHADYIYDRIETYGMDDLDIEIEAKAKDLALLRYLAEKDLKPSGTESN